MAKSFKELEVLRESRADKIGPFDTLIHKGMKEYSGWGWVEHVQWVCELTGLPLVVLMLLVGNGYVLLTDESCSAVWLVSRDHWKAKARLIYKE